jgi:hypothetical protein
MNENGYVSLLWILAAAGLGFAVACVFSRLLRLSRRVFLIPYVLLAGGLVSAYFSWNRVDLLAQVVQNWFWGLIATILLGAFVVKNVLSQPVSTRSRDILLVFDLFWAGVVYGAVDAMLLSVLPVMATWQAFSHVVWTGTWLDQIMVGGLAMMASLFVTAAYHLGYAEYNGPQVAAPMFGNGMMSLGYLLTNNPAAAVVSHVAMHVAAVLRGPATASQLPPHYGSDGPVSELV